MFWALLHQQRKFIALHFYLFKNHKSSKMDNSNIIIYQTEDGKTKIQTRLENETVWLTIEQMVELFQKSRSTINEHILNIFDEKELDKCYKQIEVGGVIHNHVPTLRYDQMPYGGVKESGLGREGVKYAMLDMLEPKILVK